MKKKSLVFIFVTLFVLMIVPVINLIELETSQNIRKKKWWSKSVLYNIDFALPYLMSMFYPIGISANPNQIMIGKDHWLYLGDRYKKKQDNKTLTIIRRGATTEDVQVAQKIGIATQTWEHWLKQKGVLQFQIILGPDKGTIYSEFLPDWMHPSPNSVTNALLAHVSQDIYIDTRPALKKAKSLYSEPLYYKTDTHWNSLGGWVAFRAFAKEVARKERGLLWLSDHQVQISTMKERRGGDLAGFLWMKHFLRDIEVVINIDSEHPIETEQYNFKTGQLIWSGGNPPVRTHQHPLLVKSKNALNQKRVLWLRDSFGEALSPFMAATFTETLQMHYDATNPMLFAQLVDTYKPDYVFITVVERDTLWKWFTELPPMSTLMTIPASESLVLTKADYPAIFPSFMMLQRRKNVSTHIDK